MKAFSQPGESKRRSAARHAGTSVAPAPATAAMSFFRDLPVGMGKDKEGTP